MCARVNSLRHKYKDSLLSTHSHGLSSSGNGWTVSCCHPLLYADLCLFLDSMNITGSTVNTVFVGDLSIDCKESDLQHLFAQYGGTVVNCKIQRLSPTGAVLGYGFVTMGSEAEAKTVMSNLDGYYLMGRYMKVREAAYGVKSMNGTENGKNDLMLSHHKYSLYLRFWSTHPAIYANEESVRQVYEIPGEETIADVSIRKVTVDKVRMLLYCLYSIIVCV